MIPYRLRRITYTLMRDDIHGFAVIFHRERTAFTVPGYFLISTNFHNRPLPPPSGGWGIHNFVLGETKKGIVKIVLTFCFGIGSILALIDFIKILIDKYEVNPEKAF